MTSVSEASQMGGITFPVLDKGFLRLDAHEASDLAVVNSARVSFAKHKETMDESDEGLIGYLMRGGHTSPFEHGYFRFHVKLPIAVVREWHRHRTWSFNEWSARYSVLEPEFYIPHRDDIRHQVGKPGAYTFERVEDDETAERAQDYLQRVYQVAYDTYETLMGDEGIAKEIARMVLPVGIYTEMYASVDPLNLMRFLTLRTDANAQREIRNYAQAMESVLAHVMPITYQAWVANGRKV